MIDFNEKLLETLKELCDEHSESYEILENSNFGDDFRVLTTVLQRKAYHEAIRDCIRELSKHEGTDIASKILYSFAHTFIKDGGR